MNLKNKIGKYLRNFPFFFKFTLKLLSFYDISLRTIVRIIKLPFRLLKINYLAIKTALIGKKFLIDPGETTFIGDGFATTLHVAFLEDKKLNIAYNTSLSDIGADFKKSIKYGNPKWRAHIVTWATNQAIKLDGDFVACGVYWGLLEKTICEYFDFDKFKSKKFYLVDTWGDPNTANLNHQVYKYPEDIFNLVKMRFSKYSNVELVRGFVPEVLKKIPIDKISFLSIDMNGDIAERATLERYYDKIVKGGIIYFDDYGWRYPKLRKTVNEFFNDKPETLLHFPSGNSVVIKL